MLIRYVRYNIVCRLDYLHGGSEMDILYVFKQKLHTRSSPNRQHGGMLSKMYISQPSLYLSCLCLLPLTLAPTYVCLLRTTHNRRFINKANIHCLIIMVYVKDRWYGSTQVMAIVLYKIQTHLQLFGRKRRRTIVNWHCL